MSRVRVQLTCDYHIWFQGKHLLEKRQERSKILEEALTAAVSKAIAAKTKEYQECKRLGNERRATQLKEQLARAGVAVKEEEPSKWLYVR